MIPSAGTPIQITHLLSGAISGFLKPQTKLCRLICAEMDQTNCFLANSATTLIYLVLRVLSEFSARREVIIPAYTAPSLVLPIRKAGLVPKPCDISLETFLLDIDQLRDCMTHQTLAVLAVHSYGIPLAMHDIIEIGRENGSYVIEDAAVAHGSRLNGKPIGAYGDVSIISLNRGKNLSTLTGGIALVDDERLAKTLSRDVDALPSVSLKSRLKIALNLIALSFVVRPWIYTLARSSLLKHRNLSLYTDFESFQYTDFQAGVGYRLMHQSQAIYRRRMENGYFLQKALADMPRITVPIIPTDAEPAFNQFPLLVETTELRNRLLEMIIKKAHVEATILYPKPVHHCYDIGIPESFYPNAAEFAQRVLLLPTHSLIDQRQLGKAVEVIRALLTTEP